jgi:transposase-like protein
MRQHGKPQAPQNAEETVRDIRRATRRQFSAEEKIRIVLEGLRGEDSIAELCRKEGIAQNLYYRWSKEFLEAGGAGTVVEELKPSPPSSEPKTDGPSLPVTESRSAMSRKQRSRDCNRSKLLPALRGEAFF